MFDFELSELPEQVCENTLEDYATRHVPQKDLTSTGTLYVLVSNNAEGHMQRTVVFVPDTAAEDSESSYTESSDDEKPLKEQVSDAESSEDESSGSESNTESGTESGTESDDESSQGESSKRKGKGKAKQPVYGRAPVIAALLSQATGKKPSGLKAQNLKRMGVDESDHAAFVKHELPLLVAKTFLEAIFNTEVGHLEPPQVYGVLNRLHDYMRSMPESPSPLHKLLDIAMDTPKKLEPVLTGADGTATALTFLDDTALPSVLESAFTSNPTTLRKLRLRE